MKFRVNVDPKVEILVKNKTTQAKEKEGGKKEKRRERIKGVRKGGKKKKFEKSIPTHAVSGGHHTLPDIPFGMNKYDVKLWRK